MGTCHHAQLIFFFFVETGFCHVAQAGLKLLSPGCLWYLNTKWFQYLLNNEILFLFHYELFNYKPQGNFLLLFLRERVLLCHPGWSAVNLAHCNLHLMVSRHSHVSASWVAGIIGMCHHAWLIFVVLIEVGFCHVGQAGFELLTSSDLPALASLTAGVIGMSHSMRPIRNMF